MFLLLSFFEVDVVFDEFGFDVVWGLVVRLGVGQFDSCEAFVDWGVVSLGD